MTTFSIREWLIKAYETRIWLTLLALTFVSLILFDRQDFSFTEALSSRTASTIIMAIAFVKVRMVILSFMEIKEAIMPLRLLFETWVIVVFSAIIYMLSFG